MTFLQTKYKKRALRHSHYIIYPQFIVIDTLHKACKNLNILLTNQISNTVFN